MYASLGFTSARPTVFVVAEDGSGDHRSVQQAIDALPPDGAAVHIRPGTYREVVTITKPHVRLVGTPALPSKVTIENDYIGWITRAKRDDTRHQRITQMLQELSPGDRYMKMTYKGKN